MFILIVLKTTTFQHGKNNTPSHSHCNNNLTKKQHLQRKFNWLIEKRSIQLSYRCLFTTKWLSNTLKLNAMARWYLT